MSVTDRLIIPVKADTRLAERGAALSEIKQQARDGYSNSWPVGASAFMGSWSNLLELYT